MSERIYLAGPMTGIPQFNFPVFDRAAAELRQLGLEVVSPAELDDPKARAAALQSEWGDPAEYQRITGLTWADFLARDVKLISDGGFDSIVCLPNWEMSRGARLETFVGWLNGIIILKYGEDGLVSPVRSSALAAAWVGPASRLEFREVP